MINIIPFHPSHLPEWNTDNPVEDEMTRQLVLTRDFKTARTCICNGRIIGFGGVDILFTNNKGRSVAELWMDLNYKAVPKEDSVCLFWRMKKEMNQIIDSSNLCRIQAVVESDYVMGNRFIQALGFKVECGDMQNMSVHESSSNLYSMVF